MKRAIDTAQAWSDQPLDETARHGEEIYETQLKVRLEAEAMGQFVAIHPESGQYAVAKWQKEAFGELRAKQPEGLLVLRRIGPPTPGDLRLAARFAGQRPSR